MEVFFYRKGKTGMIIGCPVFINQYCPAQLLELAEFLGIYLFRGYGRLTTAAVARLAVEVVEGNVQQLHQLG